MLDCWMPWQDIDQAIERDKLMNAKGPDFCVLEGELFCCDF